MHQQHNSCGMFSLQEQIALLKTNVWHTHRMEKRIRRQMRSCEDKQEKSRKDLESVIGFMFEQKNAINKHLKKLSETEKSVRGCLDTMTQDNGTDISMTSKYNSQRKHQKKLSKNLSMLVQHREDHSDRLRTREATCKMIENLLDDETRVLPQEEVETLLQELQSNSAVYPCIAEYLYHRQATNNTRTELVNCLQARENAKLALRFAQHRLSQQLPVSPCQRCSCHCVHRDSQLVTNRRRSEDFTNDEKIIISDDILKEVFKKLCFDIRGSGLKRTQRRNGFSYLEVFVGSELVTWMVKSGVCDTRYEACIIGSLLIDGGTAYCVVDQSKSSDSIHSTHNNNNSNNNNSNFHNSSNSSLDNHSQYSDSNNHHSKPNILNNIHNLHTNRINRQYYSTTNILHNNHNTNHRNDNNNHNNNNNNNHCNVGNYNNQNHNNNSNSNNGHSKHGFPIKKFIGKFAHLSTPPVVPATSVGAPRYPSRSVAEQSSQAQSQSRQYTPNPPQFNLNKHHNSSQNNDDDDNDDNNKEINGQIHEQRRRRTHSNSGDFAMYHNKESNEEERENDISKKGASNLSSQSHNTSKLRLQLQSPRIATNGNAPHATNNNRSVSNSFDAASPLPSEASQSTQHSKHGPNLNIFNSGNNNNNNNSSNGNNLKKTKSACGHVSLDVKSKSKTNQMLVSNGNRNMHHNTHGQHKNRHHHKHHHNGKKHHRRKHSNPNSNLTHNSQTTEQTEDGSHFAPHMVARKRSGGMLFAKSPLSKSERGGGGGGGGGSSILSMNSSVSGLSGMSNISGSIFTESGSDNENEQVNSPNESQIDGSTTTTNNSNMYNDCHVQRVRLDCVCQCGLCECVRQLASLSFHDSTELYRFRCDDAKIERITKQGWLQKIGLFRNIDRFYIWDGTRRQLREYKTQQDTTPSYRYPLDADTLINAAYKDVAIFSITMKHPEEYTLKLRSSSKREKDAWVRVLRKDLNPNDGNENRKHRRPMNSNSFSSTNSNNSNSSSGSGNSQNSNNNNNNNNKSGNGMLTVSNMPSANNDVNYEHWRHYRMNNRLKWSSLFSKLDSSHESIKTFREFLTNQDRMDRPHRRQLEREMNVIFKDKDTPIGHLFTSFQNLFLEPFFKITTRALTIDSIDSIVCLSADDLLAFLQHSEKSLSLLLTPATLRLFGNSDSNSFIGLGSSLSNSNTNGFSRNSTKPRPIMKLFTKLLKRMIYNGVFSCAVYQTIFCMYRRLHEKEDKQLANIMKKYQYLLTTNYQISKDLQIDRMYAEKNKINIKQYNNNVHMSSSNDNVFTQKRFNPEQIHRSCTPTIKISASQKPVQSINELSKDASSEKKKAPMVPTVPIATQPNESNKSNPQWWNELRKQMITNEDDSSVLMQNGNNLTMSEQNIRNLERDQLSQSRHHDFSDKNEASIISGTDSEFTYKAGTEYTRTTTTSGTHTQLTISTSQSYANKLLLGSPAHSTDLSETTLNPRGLHDPSVDSPLFVPTPLTMPTSTPQSGSNGPQSVPFIRGSMPRSMPALMPGSVAIPISMPISNSIDDDRKDVASETIETAMKSSNSSISVENEIDEKSIGDNRFQFPVSTNGSNNLKITIDTGIESDNGINNVILDCDRRNLGSIACSQPSSPGPNADMKSPRAKSKRQNQRLRQRLAPSNGVLDGKNDEIDCFDSGNDNISQDRIYSVKYGIDSPAAVFQMCFDKIWELSRCRAPNKKLDCLVNLKDVIIQCIDENRDLFEDVTSIPDSEIESVSENEIAMNGNNGNNDNNSGNDNSKQQNTIVSKMNDQLFNNGKSHDSNDDNMDIVSVLSSKLSHAQFSSINGKRDLSKIDEISQTQGDDASRVSNNNNPVLSTLALGFHSDSRNKAKNKKNNKVFGNLNSSMPIRTHGIVDMNDDTNVSLISVNSEISEYWTQTMNDRASIASMVQTLTPRKDTKTSKSTNSNDSNNNDVNNGESESVAPKTNNKNNSNKIAPLTKQNVNEQNEHGIVILSEKRRPKKKKYLIKGRNKKRKEVLIGSDDMLPLFCYAFVQSQLPSLHAEIAFMSDFMSEEDKQMKPGFCLATLQAAVAALIDGKLPVTTS